MSTPMPLRQLGAALRAFLVATVVLGLAYPLVMTGLAQVVLPGRADGSLVESRGVPVGSRLLGQAFTRPLLRHGEPVVTATGAPVMVPDPAYFQSRPSAGGYDPRSSGASNLGPENEQLIAQVSRRRTRVAALDGVAPAQVPPDALLASGSGLDPDISPAYAAQQVARVAQARRLDAGRVRKLVAQHTEGRTWGFLGEPRVNVLMLNLALDRLTGARGGADSE
jgi:K+-transporting ATPase ATPase C chain